MNLDSAEERFWWCRKWQVSEAALREAVAAAGSAASAVAEYLGKATLAPAARRFNRRLILPAREA